MGPAKPTTRQSAIAFTEGVRSGWLTSDLVSWMQEHLVQTERLALGSLGVLQYVREHDLGTVALQPNWPGSARNSRTVTASQVPQLLEATRQRVLQALRMVIDSNQVAFANAALYAARVLRDKGEDGRTVWTLRLTQDIALSDQVLALFAVDALEHPAAYENELAVCDACGAVTLSPMHAGSRHGCLAHPFGASDPHRSRSVMPTYGSTVRGRDTNS